jgi:hypothetical protein
VITTVSAEVLYSFFGFLLSPIITSAAKNCNQMIFSSHFISVSKHTRAPFN